MLEVGEYREEQDDGSLLITVIQQYGFQSYSICIPKETRKQIEDDDRMSVNYYISLLLRGEGHLFERV